jgi:hypothetical protein
MKAKSASRSGSSRHGAQLPENEKLIVVKAEEVFTRSEGVDWGESFPKTDDAIDLTDIPETDFGGPEAVRGRYRELALQTEGFVQLEPDVRRAFPDTQSVNRALRGLIAIAEQTVTRS